MPRKIISQDPVIVPPRPEETFGEMEVAMFKVMKTSEGLRLSCNLQQVDSEGEPAPDGKYHISVKDLDSQMAVTPKFAQAWDTIVDTMGLAYDFYRLKEKVEQAIAAGEDATELIAARNSALAALREPV